MLRRRLRLQSLRQPAASLPLSIRSSSSFAAIAERRRFHFALSPLPTCRAYAAKSRIFSSPAPGAFQPAARYATIFQIDIRPDCTDIYQYYFVDRQAIKMRRDYHKRLPILICSR